MTGLVLLISLLLGLFAVGGVVVGYGLASRSQLLARRNRVREGWQRLEAVFQRRHELAASLLETVERHAVPAASVLEDVRQARETCEAEPRATAKRARAEAGLSAALDRLVAEAEADPALHAAADCRQLQGDLGALEGELEKALAVYGRAVQRLNALVERFPSSIAAALLAVAPVDAFEVAEPAERG